MLFAQFLQFLQLTILHFHIQSLLLIGDNQTLSTLTHVRRRLDNVLPTTIVSFSTDDPPPVESTFCPICRPAQLILIHLDAHFYPLIRTLITQGDANRMVLLRTPDQPPMELQSIVIAFAVFNLVLAQVQPSGELKLSLWGRMVHRRQANLVTSYDRIDGIFRSNDTNALLFRNELERWPLEVEANYLNLITPPYIVYVKDVRSGKTPARQCGHDHDRFDRK